MFCFVIYSCIVTFYNKGPLVNDKQLAIINYELNYEQ